jgi:hypothetical protein
LSDPTAEALERIVTELRATREEVAALRTELLRRKAAGTKRARTRAKVVADESVSYPVSELEVARMARQLARRRR